MQPNRKNTRKWNPQSAIHSYKHTRFKLPGLVWRSSKGSPPTRAPKVSRSKGQLVIKWCAFGRSFGNTIFNPNQKTTFWILQPEKETPPAHAETHFMYIYIPKKKSTSKMERRKTVELAQNETPRIGWGVGIWRLIAFFMLARQNAESQTTPKSQDINADYLCEIAGSCCSNFLFHGMLTKQKAESQTIPNLQDINADPLCQ